MTVQQLDAELVQEIQTRDPIDLWRLSKPAQLEIIREMSFVKILPPDAYPNCQGFKSSGSPRDRKCKNVGRYVFKHLKDRGTKHYCWQHLRIEGLEGPNGERDRVNGWLRRHGYIQ